MPLSNLTPGADAATALRPVITQVLGDNGLPLARVTCAGALLQGPATLFHPNGAPAMQAEYRDGLSHGLLALTDEAGLPVQDSQRVNGMADGVTTTYYRSGKPMVTQRYAAGVLNGETLCYAESGDVSAQLRYILGQLDGEATYFAEGRLVRRERYRAGLLEGETQDYGAQPTPCQITPYRANVVHGAVRRFWPNGQLMEEVAYRNGKPAGDVSRFDQAGREILAETAATTGLMKHLEKLVKGH